MRVSIDRLRKGLLAGASLLVLVIAGFLTYAHYRTHRFLKELPRKLGADIRQETNAFTWSQTVKGRTVFTVHAAKAIQHQNGQYTMHDVSVSIYGQGEDQQRRVDRIYGKEFELDQTEGVVKAMGEVHLDLQAPSKAIDSDANPGQGKNEAAHDEALKNAQLIHVKTSGLVYLQKLGVAATDQYIEFEYNGLTGHATGADYNADSGVLLLHSAVQIAGLDHGKPILLTANRGELNRLNRKVLLTQARFVTSGDGRSGQAGRQTVEAQQATAILRKDGTAEKLIGEGNVSITGDDGSKVTAQHGEMLLTEANKPQSLWLRGDVHYSSDSPERKATGEAQEARMGFDAQGHLTKTTLQGAVHLLEHAASNGPQRGSDRELSAATVDLAMATAPGGRSWLRSAKASGDARLRTTEPEKDGKGVRRSLMRGDVLTARFELKDGNGHLVEVHGDGNPALEQRTGDGAVQTSSADVLNVTFRPGAADRSRTQSTLGVSDQIDTALLQGHVVIVDTPGSKGGSSAAGEKSKATAEKATYDGRTGKMALTGTVQLESAEGVMWASRVIVDQPSGDALATGGVKANYQQSGSTEALHILADHADLKKATATAIFYGTAGKPARLWQQGSQIEAPVLQFERAKQRLLARGDNPATAIAVRTVLVSTAGANNAGSSSAPVRGASPKAAIVHIGSREMIYSNEARTAQFTGGVKVESADGVMLGQRATAYFLPVSQKKQSETKPQSSDFLGSSVERIVVNGDIEIRQQERRATGDQLIYTASDGTFILTGTEQRQPKVVDASRGTITGRELRFREQDASVVISNGDANNPGLRVHTETRVKRER